MERPEGGKKGRELVILSNLHDQKKGNFSLIEQGGTKKRGEGRWQSPCIGGEGGVSLRVLTEKDIDGLRKRGDGLRWSAQPGVCRARGKEEKKKTVYLFSRFSDEGPAVVREREEGGWPVLMASLPARPMPGRKGKESLLLWQKEDISGEKGRGKRAGSPSFNLSSTGHAEEEGGENVGQVASLAFTPNSKKTHLQPQG